MPGGIASFIGKWNYHEENGYGFTEINANDVSAYSGERSDFI